MFILIGVGDGVGKGREGTNLRDGKLILWNKGERLPTATKHFPFTYRYGTRLLRLLTDRGIINGKYLMLSIQKLMPGRCKLLDDR